MPEPAIPSLLGCHVCTAHLKNEYWYRVYDSLPHFSSIHHLPWPCVCHFLSWLPLEAFLPRGIWKWKILRWKPRSDCWKPTKNFTGAGPGGLINEGLLQPSNNQTASARGVLKKQTSSQAISSSTWQNSLFAGGTHDTVRFWISNKHLCFFNQQNVRNHQYEDKEVITAQGLWDVPGIWQASLCYYPGALQQGAVQEDLPTWIKFHMSSI